MSALTVKMVKRGDKFYQMERRAPSAARNASFKTARAVRTVARQLSPVSDNNEPGHVHMRDTIEVVEVSETRHAVVVDKEYASFVENGTVHQDAQPFLRPAFELCRKDFEAALRDFFQEVTS